MKRPSFQFYPADWRKDAALQSCSIAARGMWVDLLCIAHECEPYGYLTVNGKPMVPTQIARLVGLSVKECLQLLNELNEAGVSSVTSEGVIYSRRMVRDEDVRNRRAVGGAAGAEHGIKGAEDGIKGGRPKKETGDIKPPLEPPPSSSSSSSSPPSVLRPKNQEKDLGGDARGDASPSAPPERKQPSDRATRIPADFELNDQRIAVATAEKLPDIQRTFAKFCDYWRAASGAKARKIDWDATWRNWCRSEADRGVNGTASRPQQPYKTKFDQAMEALDRA